MTREIKKSEKLIKMGTKNHIEQEFRKPNLKKVNKGNSFIKQTENKLSKRKDLNGVVLTFYSGKDNYK